MASRDWGIVVALDVELVYVFEEQGPLRGIYLWWWEVCRFQHFNRKICQFLVQEQVSLREIIMGKQEFWQIQEYKINI